MFFDNVLPVFNITVQTVLGQAVYVKQVSWGSLYVSYTLDILVSHNLTILCAMMSRISCNFGIFHK